MNGDKSPILNKCMYQYLQSQRPLLTAVNHHHRFLNKLLLAGQPQLPLRSAVWLHRACQSSGLAFNSIRVVLLEAAQYPIKPFGKEFKTQMIHQHQQRLYRRDGKSPREHF